MSYTLNRSKLPSGDQRGHCGLPVSVLSLQDWVPSFFTKYKSLPFAYTISPPSSDQAAACAEIAPSGRGEPPSNGATHNGLPELLTPRTSQEPSTSISDLLGERS